MSESKATDRRLLTIMGNIDGSARGENGENTRIVETGSVCGAELDLKVEAGSINTCSSSDKTRNLP